MYKTVRRYVKWHIMCHFLRTACSSYMTFFPISCCQMGLHAAVGLPTLHSALTGVVWHHASRFFFDPLQNRHPLTDRQKNCHRRLCRRPIQMRQIWSHPTTGGFLANGRNITKIILFIYLFMLFSGIHLHVRRVDGFSLRMTQTMRTRARMCLFGFR